jgi:hypothetical protein
MEAILKRYDDERRQSTAKAATAKATTMTTKTKTKKNTNDDNISVALEQLIRALRDVLPSLEGNDGETKTSDEEYDNNDNNSNNNNGIDAQWLIQLLRPVATDEEHLSLMVRLVWEAATQSKDQQQQEEALFAALGASDEAMTALFTIVPNAIEIRNNITIDSLREAGVVTDDNNTNSSNNNNYSTYEDPVEIERQRLRQDAYEAAQIAAIAQVEADAVTGVGTSAHATHSVTRSSEQALIKAARKAQKRANQTFQKAKAAGAVIDENDLYHYGGTGSDGLTMGDGGLMNRSEDDLRAMQASLAPEGSRILSNEPTLPSGTIREDNDVIGYEKVTIPAPRLDPDSLHERLRLDDIFVNENEIDCARAFKGTDSLNPMQSAVFETAFRRRENLLVCAPTGAGKTNVAMTTVTAHFRDVGLLGGGSSSGGGRNDGGGGALETGKKVVYIAPMKALAQEVVEKFSSKLKPLGLIVRELTGDMQLTRAEAQSANVIVTTPEKWDGT